jgi:hypothetical protein
MFGNYNFTAKNWSHHCCSLHSLSEMNWITAYLLFTYEVTLLSRAIILYSFCKFCSRLYILHLLIFLLASEPCYSFILLTHRISVTSRPHIIQKKHNQNIETPECKIRIVLVVEYAFMITVQILHSSYC